MGNTSIIGNIYLTFGLIIQKRGRVNPEPGPTDTKIAFKGHFPDEYNMIFFAKSSMGCKGRILHCP